MNSTEGVQSNLLVPQGLPRNIIPKRRRSFPRPKRKTSRDQDTYAFEVSKHLNSVAMTILNENRRMVLSRDPATHRVAFSARYASLGPEDLAEHLLSYVESKARKHIVWDSYEPLMAGDRDYRLPYSTIERYASDVAEWAVEHWEPTLKQKLAAAGRKGGKVSRRGPKYTPERLIGLEHLSKAQQARKLGCSERTIANLRRQAAEQTCAK